MLSPHFLPLIIALLDQCNVCNMPTQERTKWRNCRLTPKNSRLPTWLGCFGCQQVAGYPKTDFFFYVVKILTTYHVILHQGYILYIREPFWGSITSFFLVPTHAFLPNFLEVQKPFSSSTRDPI